MRHVSAHYTVAARLLGHARAQASVFIAETRRDTPPSRALAPRALKAGGRDRAVLRRLAARGGEQPALSARGLPEHAAWGSGDRV